MEHTLAITTALILVVSLLIIGIFALTGSFALPKEALAAENSAETETPKESIYILGIYNGKLALFNGESRYPLKIYDLWVRSLPSSDISRLEEGIKIFSEEQLFSIIEDFTS